MNDAGQSADEGPSETGPSQTETDHLKPTSVTVEVTSLMFRTSSGIFRLVSPLKFSKVTYLFSPARSADLTTENPKPALSFVRVKGSRG